MWTSGCPLASNRMLLPQEPVFVLCGAIIGIVAFGNSALFSPREGMAGGTTFEDLRRDLQRDLCEAQILAMIAGVPTLWLLHGLPVL